MVSRTYPHKLPSQNLPLWLFLGLVVLAAWPLVYFQQHLEKTRGDITAEQSIQYLPSGKFLSPAVLGFDNLAADALWVRGIALFGDRFKATEDDAWYQWLFQLIDLATELDPRDFRIYKYGGIMLRLSSLHIDQSTYVFHKGLEHCPREYFLPFGIAMNYLEFRQNPEKAAEYMQMASKTPNAPFYLRNLAASMLHQTDKGEAAVAFLEEQLAGLKPGSLQHTAVSVKIEEVKHDNAARRLQAAMNEFLSRFNRVPQPLEEMKGVTWKGNWPEDPYGGHFVLNPRSGKIESSQYAEVRARIQREHGLGLAPKENAP